MCCNTLPCYNYLTSVYNETCYNSLGITHVEPASFPSGTVLLENLINQAGSIQLVGSSTLFADVTEIQIPRILWASATYPTLPAFADEIVLNSIITVRVTDHQGTAVVGPKAGVGRYLVTAVGGSFVNTAESGTALVKVFTVTFLSGNGDYGNDILAGDVASTLTGWEDSDFIKCSYIIPTPNFEEVTIFQLNTPGEDEEVCEDLFTLCDFVSSITYTCDGDFEYPTGGVRIGSFVYWDADTEEYTTTVTDFFVGFTLQDIDGNAIYTPYCDKIIPICLLQAQEINTNISSFKVKVLSLQKIYAEKVLRVIKKIQFGHNCSNELLQLKHLKDIITLLNKYDIRDIPLDDTVFNSITYEKIKSIMYKIK